MTQLYTLEFESTEFFVNRPKSSAIELRLIYFYAVTPVASGVCHWQAMIDRSADCIMCMAGLHTRQVLVGHAGFALETIRSYFCTVISR